MSEQITHLEANIDASLESLIAHFEPRVKNLKSLSGPDSIKLAEEIEAVVVSHLETSNFPHFQIQEALSQVKYRLVLARARVAETRLISGNNEILKRFPKRQIQQEAVTAAVEVTKLRRERRTEQALERRKSFTHHQAENQAIEHQMLLKALGLAVSKDEEQVIKQLHEDVALGTDEAFAVPLGVDSEREFSVQARQLATVMDSAYKTTNYLVNRVVESGLASILPGGEAVTYTEEGKIRSITGESWGNSFVVHHNPETGAILFEQGSEMADDLKVAKNIPGFYIAHNLLRYAEAIGVNQGEVFSLFTFRTSSDVARLLNIVKSFVEMITGEDASAELEPGLPSFKDIPDTHKKLIIEGLLTGNLAWKTGPEDEIQILAGDGDLSPLVKKKIEVDAYASFSEMAKVKKWGEVVKDIAQICQALVQIKEGIVEFDEDHRIKNWYRENN